MERWDRLIVTYTCTLLVYSSVCVKCVLHEPDGLNPAKDFKIITDGSGNSIDNLLKYETKRDDYLVGYKFKNETKCLEVKYKDSTLWKHVDKYLQFYPSRIILNFYSKMMLLEYGNKWACYYKHRESNSMYNDNSSDTTPSPSDLSVVTYSDAEYRENDESQFEKRVIGDIVSYKFKNEAKCVELRFRGNVLWKYNSDESGNKFPKRLHINLHSKMVMVDLTEKWSYFEKWSHFSKFPQPETSSSSDLFEDFSRSNIKILTVGRNNSSLVANDQSSYEFKQHGKIYEYKFKNNSKCVEVTYKNNTLWKYDEAECRNSFPKSIYINTYAKMVLIDLNNDWSYFYKYRHEFAGERKSEDYLEPDMPLKDSIKVQQQSVDESLYKKSLPEPYDIKVYEQAMTLLDLNTRKSTPEFHYYRDEESNTDVYIAKRGCLIRHIKKSPTLLTSKVVLWNGNRQNHDEYSNRVLVANSNNSEVSLAVYFVSGRRAHLSAQFQRYFSSAKKRVLASTTVLPPSKHPSGVKVTTVDESGTKENDTTKFEVILDKSTNMRTGQVEFLEYHYRFNSGAMCNKFEINDQLVWSFSNEDRFPTSIYYHEDISMVFVEFDLSSYQVYKKRGKRWEMVLNTFQKLGPLDRESSNPVPTQLDILLEEGSERIHHFEDDLISTFTSGFGYSFNRVTMGNAVIWEAQNDSKYAKKVQVIKKDNSFLAIYLVDGSFVLYNRDKDKKSWSEITSTRSSLSKLKMFYIDPSTSENVEMKPDHYYLESFGFSYGYKFKKEVKCSHVEYNGKLLWKYDPSLDNSYPNGVYLNLRTNYFIFDFKGQLKIRSPK